MALDAGRMLVTLEFAQGLKDCDILGRMDPYAVVVCGSQKFRTKTHTDGGRNPVWSETFAFNIINENNIDITIYDEDTITRDDLIGSATVSLAKAREQGSTREMVPVVSKKSGKQRGHVSVGLKFESNAALKAPAPAPAQAAQPQPQPQQPGVVYMAAPPPYMSYAPYPTMAPAPAPMPAYGYAPAPAAQPYPWAPPPMVPVHF